jgi:hypothetical protein
MSGLDVDRVAGGCPLGPDRSRGALLEGFKAGVLPPMGTATTYSQLQKWSHHPQRSLPIDVQLHSRHPLPKIVQSGLPPGIHTNPRPITRYLNLPPRWVRKPEAVNTTHLVTHFQISFVSTCLTLKQLLNILIALVAKHDLDLRIIT